MTKEQKAEEYANKSRNIEWSKEWITVYNAYMEGLNEGLSGNNIDWLKVRSKILDAVVHYGISGNKTEIIDKFVDAIQSALPLPYKPWKPEVLKMAEAKKFADWIRWKAQPIAINRNWMMNDKTEVTTDELYTKFLNSKTE